MGDLESHPPNEGITYYDQPMSKSVANMREKVSGGLIKLSVVDEPIVETSHVAFSMRSEKKSDCTVAT